MNKPKCFCGGSLKLKKSLTGRFPSGYICDRCGYFSIMLKDILAPDREPLEESE